MHNRPGAAARGLAGPGPDPARAASGPAGAAADLRGAGRRHGLQGGAAARERAGDRQRDLERRHRQLAGHQLRRAAPVGAGHEHHADLGTRLQHQHARRHLDALHGAAGAHRRPQPLPRLLRLRGLGLPADQPERGAPDRGHPRAGLGRVGRQCALGRRQLHHQDAARDAGQQLHHGRGHVWPRGEGQRRGQRRAVVLQRHARRRRERPLVVQDLGWRARAGRAAASAGHHRQRAEHAVSVVCQQRHAPAEVRLARGLRGARGRLPPVVLGRLRRHRGHHPHRHRAVRHEPRHQAGLRLGAVDQGRAEVQPVHEHP